MIRPCFRQRSANVPAKRLSYHTDFTANPGNTNYINPLTGRGPIEGRPPGEVFAHQRWSEFFPKVGYVASWAGVGPNAKFHPSFPAQETNSVWTYGTGRFVQSALPPPLIKGRYGEPILKRVYNNTPIDRTQNNGFGRNETQLHFHNAHNGAESDGAANVHHFPGTFYDYRWSTTLARRDKINTNATDRRASGPDGKGGLINVAGDYRELQGTMWAHDHRFFFTAENVYKGNLGMINYYSGPDRGNEDLDDGVNLMLPSGSLLDSGNLDFDVNLVVSDSAFDRAVSISSTSSTPMVSSATCLWSTSPTRRSLRCCRGGIASVFSMPVCRGSSSCNLRTKAATRCHSRSSPTMVIWWCIQFS